MKPHDQSIVDALTVALPLLQLALRSAETQHADIAKALDAVARAAALLKPTAEHIAERKVERLELAIVRTGRTLSEVAFLCGMTDRRLAALVSGEPMTDTERDSLEKVLPDFRVEKPRGPR